MSANSPLRTENKLRAFLLGLAEALAGGKSLLFRGAALDEATIRSIVEPELDDFLEVHALEIALSVAVAKRQGKLPATKKLLHDLQVGAETTFGDESKEFLALGFQPKKKPGPRPVAKLQLQVERLRATRRARGTLGTRQREAIRGDVPAPTQP